MPAIAEDHLTAVVSQIDLTQTPHPVASRVRTLDVLNLGPRSGLPRCGEDFGAFTLVDELGRGAFGRVFLANEHNLANRLVALKVSRKPNRESQKLARLQHTNIVPIHNAFVCDGWHVVQMPYFGRQTLAHLIDAVRAEKTFPKVNPSVFASTQMRAETTRKPPSNPSYPSMPFDSDIMLLPEVLKDAEPQPSRELLVGLAYTDAAIWLVARMADGLSHAHAKGILHLDLKPHNVLLSDDGQPMLLDFNLAYDVTVRERDRVGGTWPYMSPEQIFEYTQRPGSRVDSRSDLFALGVMFYELLTLKHPFPPVPSTDAGLTSAISARQAGAPDVRLINPGVPASIAAVVAKLLAPAPADRYQSADELREDLRRHAEHRPLKFASDHCIRERVAKWHRRNPRTSLVACIAVMAVGLVFSAAQMMAWSHDRDRTAAEAKADDFRKDLVSLRSDLTTVTDTDRRAMALASAKKWLDDYSVGSTPGWATAPSIRLLPDADRDAMQSALAETALLAAHAEWLNGRHTNDEQPLARARELNAKARTAFGDHAPGALSAQATELAGGKPFPVMEVSIDPADLYARAARLLADGNCGEAARHLVRLVALMPDHFAGQFALGYCYEQLGQRERAMERFLVAKPLGTHDARPSFHRGMLLAQINRGEEAEAEFTEALQRDKAYPGVRLHRGLLRKYRKDYAGAREDFTAELGNSQGHRIVALAMRAQVHAALGDKTAANVDLEAIDAITPVTDLDYVARAAHWLQKDPARALRDYDAALKLNGDCYAALMNKAHVYAEKLQNNDLAMASMAKAVKNFPNINKVRAGHAVLLARLGKRTEAHAEAEAALLLGSDALVTYQASNVYAITSKDHPEDAARAIALFRQCVKEGYRDFNFVAKDTDVDNIRDLPEFVKVLRAAQELK